MILHRPAIVGRAHAKINLDLRVLGLRSDGYHELRTVFQTLELHDLVIIQERRGPFEVRCALPGVPLDGSNLVWRAATLLWSGLGRPGPPANLVMTIEKTIPVQAGLGGGSADAAAALQGLARLWKGVPAGLLGEVGASLGADVSFFLTGGTALGLGRGDEIYPLIDLPPQVVLIARPGFGVATPDAYRWYDEDLAAALPTAQEPQALPGLWPARTAHAVNDLEPGVVRRHPGIGELKAALRGAGAGVAAMSGSGSAVFGLFTSVAAAARAQRRLSKAGADTILTRTIGRTAYQRVSRPARRRRPVRGPEPGSGKASN